VLHVFVLICYPMTSHTSEVKSTYKFAEQFAADAAAADTQVVDGRQVVVESLNVHRYSLIVRQRFLTHAQAES